MPNIGLTWSEKKGYMVKRHAGTTALSPPRGRMVTKEHDRTQPLGTSACTFRIVHTGCGNPEKLNGKV